VRAIARGTSYRKGLRQQFFQLLENRAHFVAGSGRFKSLRPAKIFLECADAARADYLIRISAISKFWKKTKVISSASLSDVGPHLLS